MDFRFNTREEYEAEMVQMLSDDREAEYEELVEEYLLFLEKEDD